MIKVGITGQTGFIGTHLFNTLGLYPETFERVQFRDEFFRIQEQLNSFVATCDVIVHLAAVNRAQDQQFIYSTNVSLVKKLISACESVNSKPNIIFSSSTQEEKDNQYGKSKKLGRELFEEWAERNNANFTGLIIPNVYGPFCLPYYNSVIATFCHQLTHNEQPKIDVDSELKLIYVGELVQEIIRIIEQKTSSQIETIQMAHTSKIQVSHLLTKLDFFRSLYFEQGIFPCLDNDFEKHLFNTFVCYIDHSEFFPFTLTKNTDNRGDFVEIIKMNSKGQVSFSTTKPGITRGNHFHTMKAERFAVIKGKAIIELRRIGTNEKLTFFLDGNQPSFVDMPVWYTHNITNIGDDELYTLFWTNEHFNQEVPDTYFETV